MNIKKLYITALIAALTASFSVQAQIPQQNNQTHQGAPIGHNAEEQVQQIQRVRVRVVDLGDNDLETKMENLSISAVKEGLGQMSLNGIMSQTVLPNGAKQIEITLNEATMSHEDSGKTKRTTIEKPFKAKVIPNPEIQVNDQFDVEVDPIELLAAFQRLQEDEEKEEEAKEDEEKEEPELKENEGGKFADNKSASQDLGVAPDFNVEESVADTITTELCDPRIDLEQLAAIVQERTIVNGTPGECSDTLTRYPLQQRFTSCPIDVDVDALLAYPQFEYYYETEQNGIVIATTCQREEENPIAITESADGCGIVHDFTANISNQQTRLVFTHNGVEEVARGCQNSATTYPHTTTQDGCNPVFTDTEVTFQDRVIITVDGSEVEIRECLPDLSTTTAISTEECQGGNRYTHDFVAGQSRLNLTFFYLDTNGDRQDVAVCAPGSTTFDHGLDQTNCTPSYNDIGLETTYRSQTFITDNGNQVFLTGCEDELPAIPYVRSGDRWQIASSSNTLITLSSTDTQAVGGSLQHSGSGYDGGYFSMQAQGINHFRAVSNSPIYNNKTLNLRANYCAHEVDTCQSWAWNSWSSQRYCASGTLSGNWSVGGININKSQSTQPTWTTNFSGASCSDQSGQAWCGSWDSPSNYSLNCSTPTCLHTHLRAHPVYLRADNSEYINTADTTANMHICGTGSNLDGTNR